MKFAVFFSTLLCIGGLLYAQETPPSDELLTEEKPTHLFFFGYSPEVNLHSRNAFAVGRSMMLGYDHMPNEAVAVKTGYFYNLDTVTCLELLFFYRYYLPWKLQKPDGTFFVQSETGAVIFYEFGRVYPAFTTNITAGLRVFFNKYYFAEPAIRFGFPVIWGASVSIGRKLHFHALNKGEGK